MKRAIKTILILLVLFAFVIVAIAPLTRTWSPCITTSTGDPSGGSTGGGIPPGVTAIDVNLEIKPETIDLASNGVYTIFVKFPIDVEGGYPTGFEGLAGQKMHMKDDVQGITFVSLGDEIDIYIFGSVSNGTDDLYFGGVDTVRVIYEGSY